MEKPGNRAVAATLNELIAACRNGEKGYLTAAVVVKDAQLTELFNSYAEQRSRFATELQELVRGLGARPEEEGDLAGAVHRSWISLKSVVANGKATAIVAECKTGEEAALTLYEEATNKELPAHVSNVVERQYLAIRAAYDRLRALRAATN